MTEESVLNGKTRIKGLEKESQGLHVALKG